MRSVWAILLATALVFGLSGCDEPPKPSVNLSRAVHIGDLDQIKRHMYWGADPNRPDADGNYPLQVAVAMGRVAIAKELLKHGAKTDVRDPEGRTPLHVALANGKVPAARLLLAQGTPDDMQALLQDLVREDALDRDTLAFLLQHGADVNAGGPDGSPPLHVAVTSGNVKLANYLIAAGADVNLPDASGATPLALAAAAKDRTTGRIMADLLRQYGATD